MPEAHFLSDIDTNPSEATVDEHTLLKGDSANAARLTDDQIDRLEATGVKLESIEVDDGDEFDQLKGEALDDAVAEADLELPSNAKADDKRDALRAHAAEGGS